jgi:hypothetical protein
MAVTRYYVDAAGRYLGGFEGAEPPAGSVEISAPPQHGSQVRNMQTGEWSSYVAPQIWTSLEFIERFTDAEQVAIVTAAQSSVALRLWYDKAMAATQIISTDPRLTAGMQTLVDVGLITAQRKAEILGSA